MKPGVIQVVDHTDTDKEVSATYYMHRDVRNPSRRLERWLSSNAEILTDERVRKRKTR